MQTRNPAELAPVRSPLEAFNTLRDAATELVVRLFATLRHRWTMRTIGRFSDRRLRDMGFERDWDGTVVPIVDGK
jgi:hypothetical protein